MFENVVRFIRSLYPEKEIVPLHEPRFIGREKEYVNAAIDSTFVSSVGKFVNLLEDMLCEVIGTDFAIATVNGTAALHVVLKLVGVGPGEEVITQPFTFVATANAISYCGAKPIFLDVESETLGLDPAALERFLKANSTLRAEACYNKITGSRIAACVAMHTFGHPCRIDVIADVCKRYHLPLIEDAAEAIGSMYKGQHTGTFGHCGIFSFNGNKTITCGGGGVIVTNDEDLARAAKHMTTTAKVPHSYQYVHDAIGFNYRLPNLNAAVACAQLEQLDFFLERKRKLAKIYHKYFESLGISFMLEPDHARSNYWLNAIVLPNREIRDKFLEETNKAQVMTRSAWKLLNTLVMYRDCQTDSLSNAQWLEERIVNLPSSVRV